MNFKKLTTLTLLLIFVSGLALFSAPEIPAIVSVEKLDINDIKTGADNDWLEMAITLKSESPANIKAALKDTEFLKNIGVKAILAYPKRGGANKQFVFFDAELKIAVMEGGVKRMAYFYMPGDVVEMYDLDKKPDYAFVELSVDGKKQPLNEGDKSMYGDLKKKDQVASFLNKASSEAQKTKGYFLPIVDAPWYVQGKIEKSLMPSYIKDKN